MDDFGKTVKTYRIKSNLTRESLSEKLEISTRYLLAIESENKKPSFDLLYKLIRELSIPANLVFYPELQEKNIKVEDLHILLNQMDDTSLNIMRDVAHSLNKNL